MVEEPLRTAPPVARASWQNNVWSEFRQFPERKGVISEIFYEENVGPGGDSFDNGDGRDGDVHRPGRCGGNPRKPVRLPLQLSNDKPGWTTGINAIGKVLASLDGGVGWQAQPYSSTTAFQGVVRAAATTSQAPPVFTWWSGQQLVPLVKAGALANMTSLVKVWEAKYGLNPDVENAYEVNGQYYGAPLYTSDWVMYYNKKDFAKYGLGACP